MLWLILAIVLLIIAIAGGVIVHPLLFALAIVALLVFFGLVRPAMRAALGPKAASKAGGRLDAIADDPNALPALPAPVPRTDEHIASARQLARSNPAAVAGILRNWVDGSEAAAPAAR